MREYNLFSASVTLSFLLSFGIKQKKVFYYSFKHLIVRLFITHQNVLLKRYRSNLKRPREKNVLLLLLNHQNTRTRESKSGLQQYFKCREMVHSCSHRLTLGRANLLHKKTLKRRIKLKIFITCLHIMF